MTAQGEDILAWLNDAIRDRERAARLAESESGQNWREDPFVYGIRDQKNALVAKSREDRAASITHIALNDPASVLRRCAADRKILAMHRPVEGVGFDPDDDDTPGAYGDIASACSGCGTSDEYAVRFPCGTVRALAEGYDGPKETSLATARGQTPPTEGDQMT